MIIQKGLEAHQVKNRFSRVRPFASCSTAPTAWPGVAEIARRILEDCEASIRKVQRISRGEIGELAIGYMSALTHDFMGKALEVWRLTAPGIVVDCIGMDSVSQERALLEGRIPWGSWCRAIGRSWSCYTSGS